MTTNVFGPGHHVGTAETTSRPTPTETGKPDSWFAQCAGDGTGGTKIDEMWLNQVVDALRTASRTAGADETDEDEGTILSEAIARYALTAIYGTDGGAANAYVVNNPLGLQAPKALTTGLRVRFKPANGNTAASTLIAWGLTIKALRRPDDTALANGDLPASEWTEAIYDAAANSAAGAWLLLPWVFTGKVIPRTSAMLFAQAATPLGWTKSVTHNDKALRVVSGTPGSGGSTAFSSVFASRTPAGTNGAPSQSGTVLIPRSGWPQAGNQVPGVGNLIVGSGVSAPPYEVSADRSLSLSLSIGAPTFTGTPMDFAVQYVDVMIATRN